MAIKKRKFKIILFTFLAAIAIAGLLIFAVYRGYVLLNNPSRKTYPIVGVDVSHYQGTIDWDILSRQNIQFAYIKATEGSGSVDNRFAENWEHASGTDLRIGAYHFFSFDSPAKTQAENFIANVPRHDGMLPPTVDVEYYADKKINPPDGENVRQQLKIMLETLEAHYHTKPVIYSTEEFWETYLEGYFTEYPLWIRNVLTKPQTGRQWTFWQYTNRGRLDGYVGEEEFIDCNVFSGDEDAWNNWGVEE